MNIRLLGFDHMTLGRQLTLFVNEEKILKKERKIMRAIDILVSLIRNLQIKRAAVT